MKRWSRVLLVGSVVGSCIGCDQVTKVAAHRSLAGSEPLSFFGDMLRLSYVENGGAFLGLGSDLPPQVRFWLFGVTVVLVLAVVAARTIGHRWAGAVHLIGGAMILGGGIGNLIDRAATGVVRDFINVGIGAMRTGIFNVADLAITTGAVVMLCSWRGPGAGPGSRPTRFSGRFRVSRRLMKSATTTPRVSRS